MNHFTSHLCAICGEERSPHQPRFLVAENSWEDKLTILQWNEQIASRASIQVACCIDHVEELVIHWMTTGSLEYPFARTTQGGAGWRPLGMPMGRVDISGGRQIGELAVHRESMERVLAENPESLRVILDALLDALHQEVTSEAEAASHGQREQEEKDEELCAVSSEPKF